jgi:hypothetical protein
MKTLHALALTILVSLSAFAAWADSCILGDDLIELNGVSASGENCIVNIKYTFTLSKNNGNKFAYIHFWLTSNYPAPSYDKGPTKDELGNVLATIALSTNSPVTLLTDYSPDNTITPVFAGLTVNETDLGDGNFRITIDNIPLIVPGACSELPDITVDAWATQSNDKDSPPMQCILKGDNVSLPVTLARFNGTLLDNAVSLAWTTTEETGGRYPAIRLYGYETAARYQLLPVTDCRPGWQLANFTAGRDRQQSEQRRIRITGQPGIQPGDQIPAKK